MIQPYYYVAQHDPLSCLRIANIVFISTLLGIWWPGSTYLAIMILWNAEGFVAIPIIIEVLIATFAITNASFYCYTGDQLRHQVRRMKFCVTTGYVLISFLIMFMIFFAIYVQVIASDCRGDSCGIGYAVAFIYWMYIIGSLVFMYPQCMLWYMFIVKHEKLYPQN